MRVFVLVVVRSGEGCVGVHPPSVWHFQQCLRARSPSCYHATAGGFLWTRDALFSSLHRTDVEDAFESDLKSAAAKLSATSAAPPRFFFFSALLDVGDNEDDADVVAMLLMELCVAWPGIIAAHMEVCRAGDGEPPPVRTRTPPATSSPVPPATSRECMAAESFLTSKLLVREETLLVLLADAVEATAAVQDAFLTRWGVHDAWDYTRALQGRSWWVSGGMVAVLPPEASEKIVEPFLMRELSRMKSGLIPLPRDPQGCSSLSETLEEVLAHALLERKLTESLGAHFRNEVVQRIESRALHRMTVVVPPAIALFLKGVPSSLLHECLLYHTVDCPLVAAKGSCGAVTQSPPERALCEVAPAASANTWAFPQQPALSPVHLQELQYRVAHDETQRLAELFREYDSLLSGGGYVRMPLAPISRFVLTQLLCQSELPSTLMLPFIRQHAGLTREDFDSPHPIDSASLRRRRTRPTEEEVVLGMKVTWAVERWTAALRRGAAAAAPASLPMWNEERILRKGGMCSWIEACIRDAKREAAELFSVSDIGQKGLGGEGEAYAASPGCAPPGALGDAADPLQRCRGAALEQLEERLFAPFPLSYRGSSTEWMRQAFREVAQEQALAALSMAQRGDVRAPWTESAAVRQGDTSPDVLGSSFSASDSDAAFDDDASGAGGFVAPTANETKNLLAQLTELEAALEGELARQAAGPAMCNDDSQTAGSGRGVGDSVAGDRERDVAPWLTAGDMQQVARNELFLQHVQLMESEMGKDQ
ncbi:hypothetical protein LSCM1_03834 [Leishmania martiniquensis]|uniref:Uncharacterized protein n=1 Tax=Leishmania martiniquensis TaxID=1580590 RepID=A0A836H8Q1_9TRYP|nr:hypothetical protein LSCM1_03834 [Leishmania martiniquensis]